VRPLASIDTYFGVLMGSLGATQQKTVDRSMSAIAVALSRVWRRARTPNPSPPPVTGWLQRHTDRSDRESR
jgi:hypothetical protein